MDLELKDKRALVSGSTAGIGYAIAEALAQEGAHVIVNGRTPARVDAAIQKIAAGKPSGKVEGFAADLGTSEGVNRIIAKYPDVEILVNNLGIFELKAFDQIPDADWFRFFEVNVLSGVRLSRHYLPRMKEHGWGRIVFISSESALQIPTEMIHYGMTKTAQRCALMAAWSRPSCRALGRQLNALCGKRDTGPESQREDGYRTGVGGRGGRIG